MRLLYFYIPCIYALSALGNAEHSDPDREVRSIYHVLKPYLLKENLEERSVGLRSTTSGTFKNLNTLHTKIKQFVLQKKSLRFTLLGFPFKSPNRETCVVDGRPDMAERYALQELQRVAEEIQRVYPPGAKIFVLCDGLTVGKAFEIPYSEIVAYEEILKKIALDLKNIKILTFRDFFPGKSPQAIDEAVLKQCASPQLAYTAERIRIMKARLEKQALNSWVGRRLMARKDVVKEMLLRTYATSQFAKQHFHKNSIVLSMHYSQDLGEKVGVRLSPSFLYPHLGNAVQINKTFTICLKKDVHPQQYQWTHTTINGVQLGYFKKISSK